MGKLEGVEFCRQDDSRVTCLMGQGDLDTLGRLEKKLQQEAATAPRRSCLFHSLSLCVTRSLTRALSAVCTLTGSLALSPHLLVVWRKVKSARCVTTRPAPFPGSGLLHEPPSPRTVASRTTAR